MCNLKNKTTEWEFKYSQNMREDTYFVISKLHSYSNQDSAEQV